MTDKSNQSTLIYDGDCGICGEWVRYWQKLTGDAVVYRTYQEAAGDFPRISEEEFRRAIYLFEPDGDTYSGAGAAFRLYRGIPPLSILAWLYRYLPGFAALSELCYGFFSRHRGLLAFLTHLCWGRNREPARYDRVTWLFLRLLGGIYLAAFVSYGVQVLGLIGSDGISPLASYLPALADRLGGTAWLHAPTIFWLYHGDGFLQFTCWLGAALAVLVIINRFTTPALILMYVLYLSLYYAGQVFLSFQWDVYLLEAGFLAIFLGTGSRVVVWLYRWLVFRFMFGGGLVKILSGDPTWRHFTALDFHFETQPLPTPLAWYAAHLPDRLLSAATALTLVIELAVPFLIFMPRRFRIAAAYIFAAFQSLIILTGNYCWFNLLTISLCLFLLDDAHLRSILPGFLSARLPAAARPVARTRPILLVLAAALVFSSGEQLAAQIQGGRGGRLSIITDVLTPLHVANTYGPFAVMTTLRNEIVIEGSRDGRDWREYQFKYKPGNVSRAPRFIIPHQPRLDWQMWFAALSAPSQNPWFLNLLIRLLQNKRAVTDLLQTNPFPQHGPRYVRARFYEYHFTTPAEKRATGNWWKRTLVGVYYPAVSLKRR